MKTLQANSNVKLGECTDGHQANNPEVVGSNPTPATKKLSRQDDFQGHPA